MNPVDHAKLKHKYSVETGEKYPFCGSPFILQGSTWITEDWYHCGCGEEYHSIGTELDNDKIEAILRYVDWLENLLITKI